MLLVVFEWPFRNNNNRVEIHFRGIMKLALLVICFVINGASTQNPIAGDTYQDCVEPVRPPQSCAAYTSVANSYRRFDGLCNHLRFQTVGATNKPFRRALSADYVDRRKVDIPRGFPGTRPVVPPPNEVSIAVFEARQHDDAKKQKLSTLFMTFGQFLDHDMAVTLHGECNTRDCTSDAAFRYPCFPMRFTKGGSRCTPFTRSPAACQRTPRERRTDRQQVNGVTSFVDASQVYGHNLELANSLRRRDGSGEMKVRSGDLLPLSNDQCETQGGCSLSGDTRADENIALYSMHTVWIREHNRVAKHLKKRHPGWNEEKLYQETRKIVTAELQNIAFNEWIPHIVNIGSYTGYNPWLDASIINAFAAAAFRFGHSLVPNEWIQLNTNFDRAYQSVSLQESFNNINSINDRGIEPTILGLVGNHSNKIDTNFAFGIARRLFVRAGDNTHMDLTAFNIQRGRDHGLKTYGAWRSFCNLPRINTFHQLAQHMPAEIAWKFKKIYKRPNDIDLFAAGIAEHPMRSFQTGPTFRCLFWHQFLRSRDGDRYYFENPGVFNDRQRRELRKASMSKILCDNLKGVVSITRNAFLQSTAKRPLCNNIPSVNLDLF